MSSISRCLVHSHRPQAVVDLAKEMVARGAELLAVGATGAHLRAVGVPVSESTPAVEATSLSSALQLLDARIHGGLLGDWESAEERAGLERQGIKRIDLVAVELEPGAFATGPAAVLRSAARNPQRVITLCDLQDAPSVLEALDAGGPDLALRRELARKALGALASLDASLAVDPAAGERVPDSWALNLQRSLRLPIAAAPEPTGLFRTDPQEAGLELVAGPPPAAGRVLDADQAWSLVAGLEQPAATLVHHRALCGFSLGPDGLAAAFERARATDPRGAFGAVAAVNRPLDGAAARGVGAGFIAAVVAPDFSAEARAGLGAGRTRLLRVRPGGEPQPRCHSTGFGTLLSWRGRGAAGATGWRASTSRNPDAAELAGLELAWHLAGRLPPVAVVICDGRQLWAAGSGQTSWRQAARLAVSRLPAGARGLVAASGHPVRFADDVALLAEAGIAAIRYPAGAPRQAEVAARADELGLAVQVPSSEEGL